MPLVIVGGIITGIFTATEAAAVAVGYAVFIGVLIYRNLTWKMCWQILDKAARTSASIYLIIAFATIISWILAMERVPESLASFVQYANLKPWQFLLILNFFFLFNGLWISDSVQLLLFAPLFTPILAAMGVHPIHFGVVMVVNVMISLMTPPYGVALYLGAIVGKVSLGGIVREAWPFMLSAIIVLALITYVPALSLWIPTIAGFIK
jgi:tripartite ATP-independent transporter DctM subunit